VVSVETHVRTRIYVNTIAHAVRKEKDTALIHRRLAATPSSLAEALLQMSKEAG
jgi:hypothetical protein